MAKYHVNINGNAGVCKAAKDNCPFGGKEEHFATKHEAQAAYENKMAGNTFAPTAGVTYDELKDNLNKAFANEFPNVKIIKRFRMNQYQATGLNLRKNQEVLFKVQGNETYDADFSRRDIEKWANDNNLKVVFNYGIVSHRAGPDFGHFIINKPAPSKVEKLDAKREQLKKLQAEVDKLEKETKPSMSEKDEAVNDEILGSVESLAQDLEGSVPDPVNYGKAGNDFVAEAEENKDLDDLKAQATAWSKDSDRYRALVGEHVLGELKWRTAK